MFDEPIRRRAHLYPKDFTPSQKIHNNSVQKRKPSVEKEPCSFSGSKIRHIDNVNKSAQLRVDSSENANNQQSLMTINP